MSQSQKQYKARGFTIIEVMIVLAIAGLIMLIVLLAVPAVQRTSRNTQRKNDITAITGAISNYILNNGGSVPGAVGADSAGTSLLICGSVCTSGNTETAKLGYYVPANVSIVQYPGSASPTLPAKDSVVVDVGYTCDSTGTKLGDASARTAAVLYAVETGPSTIAQQCTEQ